MQRHLPFLLLVATASAQFNPYVFFPQDPERHTITAASYVRRPDWNNAAEGLEQVNGAWFRGVGDETGICNVYGIYHWAADENLATPESYGLVLRLATPNGSPDTSPSGVITSVTGLALPTQAGGGRGGWIVSDGFATPIAVPCGQTWFFGVSLPANPLWPATDGHSLWSADVPGISPATVGENPRASAPRTFWTVNAALSTFTNGWTNILGVLVTGPTLHVGGLDPTSSRQGTPGQANIGLGGLFPDISAAPRRDGLNLRVQSNNVPSGIAFAAGSGAFGPVPVPVPGYVGDVYLDFTAMNTLGFGLLSGGATDIPLAGPNTISTAFVGTLFAFQAVLLDPTGPNSGFTNAQVVQF